MEVLDDSALVVGGHLADRVGVRHLGQDPQLDRPVGGLRVDLVGRDLSGMEPAAMRNSGVGATWATSSRSGSPGALPEKIWPAANMGQAMVVLRRPGRRSAKDLPVCFQRPESAAANRR